MSTQAKAVDAPAGEPEETLPARMLRAVLTQRLILLTILLVVVVGGLMVLDQLGYTSAAYSPDYLAAALINLVPLLMLALAELVVIVSGRGGIDLSVGAIVSLAGMVFGFGYGMWGWPVWLAIMVTVLFGALCGAVNGVLVAVFGFPPLIATLATYYAYMSLALVINNQRPVSTAPIQGMYDLSRAFELPLIGQFLPLVPRGVIVFLLPTAVIVWLLTARTVYGRKLYAIGTNDTAARWAGLDVDRTRFLAYTTAGAISGLVAVATVSQFASARPDAGTAGSGMALPAITIAVLGGVAITGGIGKVGGVVMAALLVVWLNAGLLLVFAGNVASQVQLLALGVILIGAALLNGVTTRKYGGTR